MNVLAARIKQRREELGYSQDELAKKLGYKSRSSINKIEMGETDIPQSKIKIFAKILETTPAFLMGWQNNPQIYYDNKLMGKKIKNARLNKGYTLEELSKITKKDINLLEKIENGEIEIDPELVDDIAMAFGKSVLVLLGWEKEKTQQEEQEEDRELSIYMIFNLLSEYFGNDAKEIIENYQKLNDIGKKEALKRIGELTCIDQYKGKTIESKYKRISLENEDFENDSFQYFPSLTNKEVLE
nr:helix-turn-helix transcriptional regulator [Sedimentibacter sp.]